MNPSEKLDYGSIKRYGFVIKGGNNQLTHNEYLQAVAAIIGPDSILSFGKMGPNYGIWVCNDEAEAKLQEEQWLTIKGESLQIWPYVNPARTLKLYGVPPFIPNEILRNKLEQYGEIRGEVESEPLYGVSTEFKHVQSFTRKVSILTDPKAKLPERIEVEFEGKRYVIAMQIVWRKIFNQA